MRSCRPVKWQPNTSGAVPGSFWIRRTAPTVLRWAVYGSASGVPAAWDSFWQHPALYGML
ncbi:DUF2537 domain-containing protein [Enterocloster bolteae]|nr:DUF2537 domain-containing protein [Enterocloster bolteae]